MAHSYRKFVDGGSAQVIADGNTVNGAITVRNPHATENIVITGSTIYSSTSIAGSIISQGFTLPAGKAISLVLESTEKLWGRSVTGTQTISVEIFSTLNRTEHNFG